MLLQLAIIIFSSVLGKMIHHSSFDISLKLLAAGYVSSIGCFVCTSVSGSDPTCDDPLPNDPSLANFEDPCLANLKGR